MCCERFAELRGEPSELEQGFATIDATTVRLTGKISELPNTDFIRGGGMAVWGDDLLLVSRSGGVFHFVDGQGLVRTAIETPDNGLAAYRDVAQSEECGDMVHKPETMRYNDLIYVDTPDLTARAVSYRFFDEERTCYGSRIAWPQLEPGALFKPELRVAEDDWEITFETSPCLELNPTWTALDGLMAGGPMAFEAPSTFYYGSGEYDLDWVHTCDIGIQDDDTDYGKVIAVDLLTGVSRHVSNGDRNMQGVALDLDGRLWVTEHTVCGGDELNLIEDRNNYGWPLETLGTSTAVSSFERRAGRAARIV